MFNFENTGREIHNLESKDLELEEDRKTRSSEVFHYVKSEVDCRQKPKLNQKTADFATNNKFNEEQQHNCEIQKAVEFKAKALFELEQVIIKIEQFKQICQ